MNTQGCLQGRLLGLLLAGQRDRETLIKDAAQYCERAFMMLASHQLIPEKAREELLKVGRDAVAAMAHTELRHWRSRCRSHLRKSENPRERKWPLLNPCSMEPHENGREPLRGAVRGQHRWHPRFRALVGCRPAR